MDVHIYDELVGQVIQRAKQINDDELHFYLQNGKHYMFYHEQDCCESVTIEDIVGNLDDLVGSPLTMAEETIRQSDDECEDSYTYTYYKFATAKGYVTVRWYGTSNGYYSESVDFKEVA